MKVHDDAAHGAEVKVQRYQHALEVVLRQRSPHERTAAITDAEHQLAAQFAEAVTAYEAGQRETAPPVTAGTAAPVQEATPARRGGRPPGRGKTGRRKARQEAPREGRGKAAEKAATE